MKQPHVIRYALDVLMESEEGEEPVLLTQQETCDIYLVITSVNDVLNKMLDKSERR